MTVTDTDRDLDVNINVKWAAFLQRFSSHRPLKAVYNIASHSCTHSHTDGRRSRPRRATAGSSAAVRVRRLAQGHPST